jgi:protein tyrosine/serine phosphatase
MLTARYVDMDRMMGASAFYLKSVVGDRMTPDEGMLRMLCGVHEDYLDAAMDAVKRDYGSVDAYLEKTAGLDPAKREMLRNVLLE